jgi:hypothetical protein
MVILRRSVRVGIAVVGVVLVVSACGGGAGTGSSRPTGTTPISTTPAGWKRCTNVHRGFSVAYPVGWYTDSLSRVRTSRTGANKLRWFQSFQCTQFDPRPFVVVDQSEFPRTAITVDRYLNRRQIRQWTRSTFDPRYNRTISRHRVPMGTHSALRFEVYQHRGIYPDSYAYGYLIDLSGAGSILIEASRYPSTSESQYRSYKQIADRMAPTARAVATSPTGT